MRTIIFVALILVGACINPHEGQSEIKQTGEVAALWMILVQNGAR